MKRFLPLALFVGSNLSVLAAPIPTANDQALAEYFRVETMKLSDRCLSDVTSASDWNAKRAGYRRQLQEMLGLWPMPERTELKAVIAGKLEQQDFSVEKIQFQASPGLYVTANLYLPKPLGKPAPTILYECGHAKPMTNGLSLGNKTVYQNDGAWYARNGYVCLVPDTLLAGEIPGIHTGTRDNGLWWWNSRGYTPAGVEAWFGIRALDYLCTRPEVDTNRFGITGHSGGGAYSWTVTALDDRIKVAAPLAGMADIQSHILDGVLDSHCDCNFFINIYRWDFPQLAALAAPRPLLIGGTDKDRIFRLPSTMRIYEKVQHVYQLCDATNQLGLGLAPGPHAEVPELQLGVMRWFNRFLKGEELPVENAAKRFFPLPELRVFDSLPIDAINTNIADTFVPLAKSEPKTAEQLRTILREKSFGGWPVEDIPLETKRLFSVERDGTRFTAWDFTSQHDVALRLYLLENSKRSAAEKVTLTMLDQSGWTNWLADLRGKFSTELSEELAGIALPDRSTGFDTSKKMAQGQTALAFFAPRGVGFNAWSGDEKALTRIRRRFMLLGQTLDGMRVWDIRRAIQALHYVREDDRAKIQLNAQGPMAINALYASLFEPNVREVQLERLPKSQADGPDYLGVLKICDLPDVIEAVKRHAEVNVQ
jgi:dienelactone hydrolase